MTTINPGNIKDRGPEEYYQSVAYTSPEAAAPESVDITMELPEKCHVKIRFRSGSDAEALENSSWSQWSNLQPGANTLPALPAALCWQYELALGAKNSLRTPRISAVKINMQS